MSQQFQTSPKQIFAGFLGLLFLLGCTTRQGTTQIDEKGTSAMKVTSTAFEDGGTIPKKYTGDGDDVSPPLRWSGAPAGTKCYALICDDPDAPRKDPWVHWVMFIITAKADANSFEMAEAVPTKEDLGELGKQGKNDFGNIGYGGPAPPPGKPHRYYFKVYAVDVLLDLTPGATKQQLERAINGHVLAHGQLMGKYSR
jgi:Raf kinase inhibitor-like YbhB/YbcL family protein